MVSLPALVGDCVGDNCGDNGFGLLEAFCPIPANLHNQNI